jgi:hypothetical protein
MIEDENRPQTEEPKLLGDILKDGVPAVDEQVAEERAQQTRLTDLSHEVGGIVAEREMMIEEHALTGDEAVGEVVREQTQELLAAQADVIEEQRRRDQK